VPKGDLTREIKVDARGEVAILKDTTNEMIRNLRETTLKNSEQDWLKTNLAKFSRMLQGQRDLLAVGRLILSELAPVVSAQHGAFYLLEEGDGRPRLKLLAGYARQQHPDAAAEFAIGEGLVGQCALEKQKITLTNVPPDYIRITSGLGRAAPLNIIVLPMIFEGQVRGVIELASFDHFSAAHHAFLDQLVESIGIVINTIEANTRTEDLLKQSQSLAAELQQTNQELQEKARLLAHQNAEVERKNQEVEQARQALEEKAAQLALTSKYKSEFLANMSHELRTPLNSLLILSDQLSKNPEGNLNVKQMEYAKTIHSSGNDLLNLINDILDLSKIESGTVVVDVSELRFDDLHAFVERTFNHVAESKSLQFAVNRHAELPRAIQTDAKRLQQILKNLLSNAFKFTRHGEVSLRIAPADPTVRFENETLRMQDFVIGFAVSDTGIGISADKQQIIFEAFQQADGSTSRKYGGTGLGLAISRELARLLGGEIHLTSVFGQGSTFTLYLPGGFVPAPVRRPVEVIVAPRREAVAPLASQVQPVDEVGDDRTAIQPGDRVLLIVENDLTFARTILDAAREHGYKGVITGFGAAALTLTQQLAPEAITLDISLPDINGWRILERLKHVPATRHIPVCVITTDEDRLRALRAGALGAFTKPLPTREVLDEILVAIRRYTDDRSRALLVIGPDAGRREHLTDLLPARNLRILSAATADEALATMNQQPLDCVVIDPALADLGAFVDRFLTLKRPSEVPVLVWQSNGLSEEQSSALRRLMQQGVAKEVLSAERLLDQMALFLHLRLADLSDAQRQTVDDLHSGDKSLTGRKVLIVDDDIRNIFALTSILEQHHMVTLSAETGRDAIRIVEWTPDVDVVLMDVMMPEMDGLDTTRAIRQNPRFRSLPIIAVTAKAMKGDREKCIEAGAWDYLSKPVDPDELLAMLRAWLVR
jgi:signal transduction histidine kinase/CheY-like chemotaxis protein